MLVVDDDALAREAIRAILQPHDDLHVVGTAAGGVDAVAQARASRPDVVLMDVQMPGMDGVESTRALLGQVDTQVIAMTSLATSETVWRMIDAGAYGYVLKDDAPADLADAVRTVARGDAFLSPRYTRELLERSGSDATADARRRAAELFATLTDREREAARLVAAGATDGEIAQTMYVALSTAKAHVQQARDKLGARNRTQIGVMVERAGQTPTS